MRKTLLGMIVALGMLAIEAQARFYLGINANYAGQILRASQKSNRALSIYAADAMIDAFYSKQKGYGFDLVLGEEDFYSRYFGTRYGLAIGSTLIGQFKMIDANFSFDLLLDFFNNRDFGIGIFGGMGIDYHYAFLQKRHFLSLDGRIGLSTLILSNHRIEAFAKLPVASIKIDSEPSLLAKIAFGLGYKIIF